MTYSNTAFDSFNLDSDDEAVKEQQTFESMEQHFGQSFSPFVEEDDDSDSDD